MNTALLTLQQRSPARCPPNRVAMVRIVGNSSEVIVKRSTFSVWATVDYARHARSATTDRRLKRALMPGVKELNEMTIGRTDDPENPLVAPACEVASVSGAGSRTHLGQRSCVGRLKTWLHDVDRSRIYGMRRFAQTLRQDMAAVRNPIAEPWSNGQTEGQINRLKTIKRSMYGRGGIDMLRARMVPL
jgi:hypothetical protein